MTKLACLLLLATASASAQPRGTFTSTTAFSSCTESWALACNMPGPNGGRHGTAKKTRHCTTYTFLPDGTYSTTGDMPFDNAKGTYRIVGPRVMFTQLRDDGTKHAFELPLNKDGSIGSLKRRD